MWRSYRHPPHARALPRARARVPARADILSTAIAPSWQQIGKLGAIAVIRTGLNFFLSKEMESEREVRKAERHVSS